MQILKRLSRRFDAWDTEKLANCSTAIPFATVSSATAIAPKKGSDGRNSRRGVSDGPKDVIEFVPNRRRAFAAVIGKQPALAFVPYEAEDNSADAAGTEAESKGAEWRDKAHGVPTFHRSQVRDRR